LVALLWAAALRARNDRRDEAISGRTLTEWRAAQARFREQSEARKALPWWKR
jgi:hypothetical protein